MNTSKTVSLPPSKVDYQGNAWSLVPKGSCEKTASPKSPSGFGQLKEFKEKA